MKLKGLLQGSSKAQLQSFYLYWFPGREVLGDKEKLAAELLEAMADHARVRQRFDSLPKSSQGFTVALLVREAYSGTVAEVRTQKHGRIIQDFEVENVLRTLQEAGYIVKVGGTGGYASEVFCVPEELALALRRTVAVDERHPLELLSVEAARGHGFPEGTDVAAESRARIERISDPTLARLVESAIEEHLGLLIRSAATGGEPCRPEWRRELESLGIGTLGVVSLKDYGIDLEEEALSVYQEVVRTISLSRALAIDGENDRELSVGADLIIDVDRALEVLRSEVLEVTREGNIYKKIEERISGYFVTARLAEFHEGSPMGHILEVCRRLQLFEEEDHRITVDLLRRRVWRKKSLLRKVDQVFEAFRLDNRGSRWSFHQPAIREIFLEEIRQAGTERWVIARSFLTAVVSRYLLELKARGVAEEFQSRCTGEFRQETLVVSLAKLHHDLSYWVVHRLALLGIIDVGYKGQVLHSLRLSRLGHRLFDMRASAPANGSESTVEAEPKPGKSPRLLVNPDFEVLIYPEAPEEASWRVSLFADRLDSDRVKRYRLSRESLKRGALAGLTGAEILEFLEKSCHGVLPTNVVFSLKEWTDGVEVVHRHKVTLLRTRSANGSQKLATLLEAKQISFERLTDTALIVRGPKNERALGELGEHLRDCGLLLE